MARLRYDLGARVETLVGVEYYEGCQTGLGQRFLTAVEGAAERLRANPLIYSFLRSPYRRCPIP